LITAEWKLAEGFAAQLESPAETTEVSRDEKYPTRSTAINQSIHLYFMRDHYSTDPWKN